MRPANAGRDGPLPQSPPRDPLPSPRTAHPQTPAPAGRPRNPARATPGPDARAPQGPPIVQIPRDISNQQDPTHNHATQTGAPDTPNAPTPNSPWPTIPTPPTVEPAPTPATQASDAAPLSHARQHAGDADFHPMRFWACESLRRGLYTYLSAHVFPNYKSIHALFAQQQHTHRKKNN